MQIENLGFGARLALFFTLPWRLLFDGALAGRLLRACESGAFALPEPPKVEPAKVEPAKVEPAKVEPAKVEPPITAVTHAAPTAALQLLAILQREGRFIDFLQENIAGFSDADIGAAARVVHVGCKRALDQHLTLVPVRTETEGTPITLEIGYDAARNRVTGNVVGAPPFKGQLAHPGWEVSRIELPRLAEGHVAEVVAPAEVEI
jgi:hypothetical protein